MKLRRKLTSSGNIRRLTLLGLLATAAVGCAAIPGVVSTASGAQPTHVSFPINHTSPIPALTPVCGFDVALTVAGTYKATIFYDQSGMVVRELDTQPDTQLIWSSPTTGKSFAYPFSAVFRTEYPSGTTPGSPAIATMTGLGDKAPGIPADAGRLIFDNATVLFVNQDGVPIVDYGLPTSSHGQTNDGDALDAALCAALAR